MDGKVQKLIRKLAKECQKEDIALSLTATNLGGEMAISQVGKGTIVAIVAHSRYTLTKEKLEQSDCDCPKHHLLKEIYGIETGTTAKNIHTFVIDDPNSLMDILLKIFRGEFE